jgi:branched-chain amino acid transport system permease protein
MARRAGPLAIAIPVLLVLAALPFVLPNYYLHTLVMAGIFVMLTSTLNLIHGYVGRLSLGHTAFYGLGGYAAALLATKLGFGLLLTLPLAAGIAALAGLFIGHVTLRFRGAHFVLVTLAFAAIAQLVANNWIDLTGGPMGLSGVLSPPVLRSWGGLRVFASKASFYWLVLGWDAVFVYLAWRIVNSPVGDAMIALREDEHLAEAVGISEYKYSMIAFVVGAAGAGIAGALYAHYVMFVSPEIFRFENMISMLVMVILGGVGTVMGPVVGAVLVTVLLEALRLEEWLREPLFGAILVAATLLFPQGIVRLVGGKFRSAAGERRSAAAPSHVRPASGPIVERHGGGAGTVPLLQVEALSIRFGGLAAVDGVSFAVNGGEIVSLIGPNGAGKTTTLNLISGFLNRHGGRITFKGRDIPRGTRPNRIAALGIIRTFQTTRGLLGVSIEQAVRIGLHRRLDFGWPSVVFGGRSARAAQRQAEERIDHLLRRVGLARDANELVGKLSYGEQRLLEIAIALAADPELLILDEPAAGMNPEETLRMMALIREIRGSGVTVLLVEHDMKLVMGLSDRIVVLDHGRLIAEGTPVEIQQNQQVIDAYLGRAAHAAA